VAAGAGINANYFARVERGEENPSFDIIRGIMKVLKLKSLDIPS
jgi:transcriptional regulator with XRE-family HTH domain